MYLQVQSSARGQIDGCSRASPEGLDDCTTSRHPALAEPLPPYLPPSTFRSLRTAPMAPHLGCDRAEDPGCDLSRSGQGRLGPGHPRTPLPTAGRKGRRERRALRGGGRTLVRSDLQAPQPPTATTAKNPTRDPHPHPPGSLGPKTPADLPLALAPTVSAAAQAPAPAGPLMGAPCRRLRNQRCSRPAPLLGGETEAPRREPEEMAPGRGRW